MGALVPRSSLVVGFLLLLLPTVAYCYHSIEVLTFTDKNCSAGEILLFNVDFAQTLNDTFYLNLPNNSQGSFQSVILSNVTGSLQQLSACQLEFDCNATGAILISFNLSVIPSPCATAGPPGTLFNKFFYVGV